MSYPTPPKAWEMVTGEWGTDADREETIVHSGQYAVVLKNTAVATKIQTDFVPTDQTNKGEKGVYLRTDNVTAGYNVTVKAYYFATTDLETPAVTYTDFAAPLNAVNTWQWCASQERAYPRGYVRFSIEKTTNLHNVYIDRSLWHHNPPRFEYTMSNTASIPTGTWTTIPYNTTGLSASWFSLSGGVATCKMPGMYSVSAAVQYDAPGSACVLDNRVLISNYPAQRDIYGDKHYTVGTVEGRLTCNHNLYRLIEGCNIRHQIWHNLGSNLTVRGTWSTEHLSRFSAQRNFPV